VAFDDVLRRRRRVADAIAVEEVVPGAGVMREPDVERHHQRAGGADDDHVHVKRVETPKTKIDTQRFAATG
jgi:hypothetical protein